MAAKSVPSNYAERIRRLRTRLGLTQIRFAERMGVSFATVNRWENDQSKPSALAWTSILRVETTIAKTQDFKVFRPLQNDPNGKLTIAHHAGYWLHGEDGRLTKAFRHICWDGCMFPNAVMMQQDTWNDILRAMIAVRDAHGWNG